MKKNLILGLAVFAVLVVAVFLFKGSGEKDLLGNDIRLVMYTMEGASTGGASVSVPFLADTDSKWYAHVALDLDGDGEFGGNEVIVQNQYAFIRKDYRNNISVPLENSQLSDGDKLKARVALTGDKLSETWNAAAPSGGQFIEGEATVMVSEGGNLLGINVPGSEDLKRGPAGVFSPASVRDVFAQGEPTIEVMTDLQVPDLDQGTMECAPTSAANGIMSLAGHNGELDKLPEDTRDIIDELKNDMDFDDGVLNSNFLAGKNAFIERHNLPIATEMVPAPTLQQIADAVSNGCAVEMSMKWVGSRSGMKNTGHTVSAVGAYGEGATNNQVAVHDPGTHDVPGADVLNSSNNVQVGETTYLGIDYPGWDGVAYVDAIFIQCWTPAQHAETGSQTSTGEETSTVEMLVIGGSYYPKSQFFVEDHPDLPGCDAPHWHANSTVHGLQNENSATVVQANDPGGCGFGKLSEVPVRNIDVTFEQSQALIGAMTP